MLLPPQESKATFYLIGISPVVEKRLDEWRTAASHGHELGNHSLTHPCDGTVAGFGRGESGPINSLRRAKRPFVGRISTLNE